MYDYSSDSTAEEQSKPATDYDTMHPPSPKISKGGNIKRSKVPDIGENIWKKQEKLMIDVEHTASAITPIDTSRTKGKDISPYNSDVSPDRPTVKIKQITNKHDELSSDVDIVPSGIVEKCNNDVQYDMINSDSDEGNQILQGKCHQNMFNKGKWHHLI